MRTQQALYYRWQAMDREITKTRAQFGDRICQRRDEVFERFMETEDCPTCLATDGGDMMSPPHYASEKCESGARVHCSCDTCF